MYYLFSGKILNFGEQLNEKMVGTLLNFWTKQESEVFRNPPTIMRMEEWCRGASDEEGNLFVVDSNRIGHISLLDFIRERNYGLVESIYDLQKKGRVITWQRKGKTKEMWLGETYPADLDEIEPEIMEKIEELKSRAEEKNQRVKFVLKSITEAPGIVF